MSAGVTTARSTLTAVGGDRVRALQHALYRAAKADPDRRFHALFDKVHRRDVLDRAWEDVRRNRGAGECGLGYVEAVLGRASAFQFGHRAPFLGESTHPTP